VRVHYNLPVSNARISGHWVVASLLVGLVGACENPKAEPISNHGSAATTAATVVDTTALQGIDLGKLDADKTKLFYTLIGSLTSPCGKSQSLRASFTTDTSCKRAPFAVRYVVAMLDDEVPEALIRDEFEKKYASKMQAVKLDTSKAPKQGTEDAPVRLAEFFDYGCPHCAVFKGQMEQVVSDDGGKVVEAFMMFPLSKHTDSKSAAQAALAAAAQGKFKEMHDMLFAKTPQHDHEHVTGYAKEIGLDLAKFEADYTKAEAQVNTDLAQGEAAGVDSTPTLFFNEKKYEGPMAAKYIELWIEEELAVNR
jgi:protein-disulfide isomerase